MRKHAFIPLIFALAMPAMVSPSAAAPAPALKSGLAHSVSEKAKAWNPSGHAFERLKPDTRAEAAPRPTGIWVRSEVPGLALPPGGAVSRARVAGAARSWKDWRNHLHTLDLARTSDSDVPDYRLAMAHAADAARANQQINYVPLITSRVVFGKMDPKGSPLGPKQEYFGLVPQSASIRSQLVTFGMRPEFTVSGGAAAPESAELTVNGRTHRLAMGGSALVSFPGPGAYKVATALRHSDGAIRDSEFDFEIKTLPDGSYFNSTVDKAGLVQFKVQEAR